MRSEDLPSVIAHVFVMAGERCIDVPLPQENLREYLQFRGIDLDNIEYAENRPPAYNQLDYACKQSFDDVGLCGCWDYEVPACMENVPIPDSIDALNDALFLLSEEPYDLENICAFAIVSEQDIDEAVIEYQARNYQTLWVPADNDYDAAAWLYDYYALDWEDDNGSIKDEPLECYEEYKRACGYVDIPGDSTWYVQVD